MERHSTRLDLPRLPAAIVFDMDGLILDTERLWMAAMIETMAEHGHHMTSEFYRTMLGTPWLRIRDRLVDRYGVSFPADAVRADWTTRFVNLCKKQLALKAGVVELLDFLDDHQIPTAVATSSPKDLAIEHLAHFDLAHRFRHIVAQGDYEQGKPDPAPYLAAARRLGIKPNDCLALEDSQNGIRSASSAGMMTIVVPDLVEPTDEISSLCLGVSLDLHEVRQALEAASAGQR